MTCLTLHLPYQHLTTRVPDPGVSNRWKQTPAGTSRPGPPCAANKLLTRNQIGNVSTHSAGGGGTLRTWEWISGGASRAGPRADTTIGKQRDRAVRCHNCLNIRAIGRFSETPLPHSPGCWENRGESCPGSRSGGNSGSNSESHPRGNPESNSGSCSTRSPPSYSDRCRESNRESCGEIRPGNCPESCSLSCSGDCSVDCSEDCPENSSGSNSENCGPSLGTGDAIGWVECSRLRVTGRAP
jgi:hypothetical protein